MAQKKEIEKNQLTQKDHPKNSPDDKKDALESKMPVAVKTKSNGKNGSTISSSDNEKENIDINKGGNAMLNLVPIALVLSIVALLVSFLFAFGSKRSKQDTEAIEQQQRQLSQITETINSTSARLENIEKKLDDFEINGNDDREKMGLLELKKALLSFQEAKNLIKDEELVQKIQKIEDEMRITLALPGMKEEVVEKAPESNEPDTFIESPVETFSEVTEPEPKVEEPVSASIEENKFETGQVEIVASDVGSIEPASDTGEEVNVTEADSAAENLTPFSPSEETVEIPLEGEEVEPTLETVPGRHPF